MTAIVKFGPVLTSEHDMPAAAALLSAGEASVADFVAFSTWKQQQAIAAAGPKRNSGPFTVEYGEQTGVVKFSGGGLTSRKPWLFLDDALAIFSPENVAVVQNSLAENEARVRPLADRRKAANKERAGELRVKIREIAKSLPQDAEAREDALREIEAVGSNIVVSAVAAIRRMDAAAAAK